MNKALNILEKNAEWIALSLAAAWIGWICWSVFLNSPVKVLDNQTLGVSDIDNYIASSKVNEIKNQINDPTIVEIKDPVLGTALPPIPPSKMPKNATVSSTPPAKPIQTTAVATIGTDPLIDVLPEIPAPVIAMSIKGLSQVQVQAMQWDAKAGISGSLVTVGNKDKVWATVFGMINDTAILEEFKRIGIKEALQDRRYMRLELERTEVYNGKIIGQGELVEQLSMNLPPYDPVKDWDSYRQWLEPQGGGTSEPIMYALQPAFYQVIKGDGWTMPPELKGIFQPGATALADAPDPLSILAILGPIAQARPAAGNYMNIPQFQRPGNFSKNADGNYMIWQHDDNATDGKTYVYRMRVVLKNPLYQNSRAVDKVKSVMSVPGKWSEYSNPVTMPTRMRWYVRSVSAPTGTIRVKAIKFDQGEMNMSNEMTASIGDIVGNLDQDKNVDYSTGWMLADIRTVGAADHVVDTRITLMNPQGQTLIRWLKQDDEEYKKSPLTQPATVTPTGR